MVTCSLHVPGAPGRTVVASRRCSIATTSTMVGYFGPGMFEQFPYPQYRLTPIRPGTAGRFSWPVRPTVDLASRLLNARQEGHPRRFTVSHGVTGAATDLCNHRYPADLGA